MVALLAPGARRLSPDPGLDFTLNPGLEAHEPPEARGLARDEVRLLVTSDEGRRISHARFTEFASFLEPGDLVVANDSGTLAAALTTTRENGEPLVLHISTRLPTGAWVVEPRKAAVEPGEELALPGGGRALIVERYAGSARLWVAALSLPGPIADYLAEHGKPIRYPYVAGEWPLDMYQNVYARRRGSAEMCSAGRPFSERVLTSLRERGVGWAAITLHTGVASLENHEAPYDEWFELPAETADAVNAARARDGRVIAVGTTVVRTLESSAAVSGRVIPSRGWTGLVITPQRGVRAVDGLLTGFHEPRATHLWMLEAIAGREHIERAYHAALTGRYLWHEFGDVHLILP